MYKIKRFSIQKEFTRAERAAFRELYRKSLVQLPTGSKGLALPTTNNPRDVIRYNQLAVDLRNLSRGDKKGFNRENAKTLLNNAGLPKLAGEVDHMVDKYTNKRALARLKRLKDRNPNFGRPTNDLSFGQKQARLKNHYNKAVKQSEEGWKAINLHQSISKSDPRIRSGLLKESYKLGIPVTRNSTLFQDVVGKYQRYEMDPFNSQFAVQNLNLGNGISRPRTGIILGRNADNMVFAHEIGHARSYLSPVSVNNVPIPNDPRFNVRSDGKYFLRENNTAFKNITDSLATLAEENSANAYGRALLNKVHRKTGVKIGDTNRKFRNLSGYNKTNYSGAEAAGIFNTISNKNYNLWDRIDYR